LNYSTILFILLFPENFLIIKIFIKFIILKFCHKIYFLSVIIFIISLKDRSNPNPFYRI